MFYRNFSSYEWINNRLSNWLTPASKREMRISHCCGFKYFHRMDMQKMNAKNKAHVLI